MPYRRLCLLWACATLGGAPAWAQVYKCEGASGRTEYRATPCEANASQRALTAPTPPKPAGPAAPRAEMPTSKLADPTQTRDVADKNLSWDCQSQQQLINERERHIAQIEAAVRKRAATGANTPTDLQSSGGMVQEDRSAIARARTQAEAMGCARLGIRVGSQEARAGTQAVECQKLREELSFWRTGKGRDYPSAADNREHLQKTLQEQRCPP